MKADPVVIEIDARQMLNEQFAAGATYREAIMNTRDSLMKTYEISRSDCELLCWRTYSNALCRKIPQGTYVDLSQSNSNLVVIRTPEQKIIFTLFDLLVIAQESMNKQGAGIANHVITKTIH